MSAIEAKVPQPSLDLTDRREAAELSVDIAGHTELLRRHGAKARRAIELYQNLVNASLARYEAQVTPWAGDGNFGTFFGPRRGEQAVLAGILVLHQIELLNLDRSVCDLGEPLRIRVGALAGMIEYREPISTLVDLVISNAHKLQKNSRAHEFAIGESILRLLPANMQEVFELIDRNFKGQQVYVYCGVPRARQPENSEVNDLITQIEAGESAIREKCGSSLRGQVEVSFLSQLNAEVKHCYEMLAKFRRWFANIDSNWSASHLRYLLDATSRLHRLENAIWLCLMDWRQGVRFIGEAKQAYDMSFFSIAQDHGHEELALGDLKVSLSEALGEGLSRDARNPSGGLSAHLEKLVRADELERMAEFLSLGRYDRNEVCEYLRAVRAEKLGRDLVRTLWLIADLVIAEEVTGTGHVQPGAGGLFGVLLADREYRPKLQVLEHFLGDQLPDAEGISRRFVRSSIEPTQRDLNVVWRTVVIAHPRPQIRYAAAEQAPLNALWQAVAYHGISLLSLAVISTRLNLRESVDLKKIFFDCVKSRLVRAIQEGDASELRLVAEMIQEFYESELFAETPYFRALEALLALFESRVERFNGQLESLEEKLGAKLSNAKTTPKKEGSIPKGLESLPPALQRHLANEGYYVEEFAFHEDDRIAVEVVRFLEGETLVRVAKAMARRKLNPALSEQLGTQKRAELLRLAKEPAGERAMLGSQPLQKEVERKIGQMPPTLKM